MINTKTQDRPDLIQSELSGLAFDSLQQAFRAADIDRMMVANGMPALQKEPIYIFIDPAAGGPQSDYCVLSLTRQRGIITVRQFFFQLGLVKHFHLFSR